VAFAALDDGEHDFDDDSSISLNSSGRAALMAKLVQNKDDDYLTTAARKVSQCLALKNMFSTNDPDIGYTKIFLHPPSSILHPPSSILHPPSSILHPSQKKH
jgi:hypothetical protein